MLIDANCKAFSIFRGSVLLSVFMTKTGSSDLLDTVATLLSFRGSPLVSLEHVDLKKKLF